MEAKGIEALKARFAGIEVKANPKTMDEIVEYIETKWQGQRVKIKESEYVWASPLKAYRKKFAVICCPTALALCWA